MNHEIKKRLLIGSDYSKELPRIDLFDENKKVLFISIVKIHTQNTWMQIQL